ncbi:MAG: hypothetical protein LUH09_10885 [Clostridiales bacterium]|nr:hypothetical protein [Clostridiales bacterium]
MKKAKVVLCITLLALMCILASCENSVATASVLETEYAADIVTEDPDAAAGSYKAVWNNITIGQGERVILSAEGNSCFQINHGGDQSVTVSASVIFDREAPATVELGYRDLSTSDNEMVEVLSASGGTVMQETFHIPQVIAYKFYIYNGSSDPITVSVMSVSVTQGAGEA